MSQIVHGVGRTLYAFAVYLCVICVPCGETLIPLLLESARRYLRPVTAEQQTNAPRSPNLAKVQFRD